VRSLGEKLSIRKGEKKVKKGVGPQKEEKGHHGFQRRTKTFFLWASSMDGLRRRVKEEQMIERDWDQKESGWVVF